MQVNEADWKLFRQKLPGWQEAHMEKLVKEYAAVISGSGKASDKFWELEERINADKKHVLQDLEDFSEDLKGRFAFVMRDQ